MDPLNCAIREYYYTIHNRTYSITSNLKNDADQIVRSSEFEFHKKRAFLSEIVQNTDIIIENEEDIWFTQKSMINNWSDWILDVPDWTGWDMQKHMKQYIEPSGFNRIGWSSGDNNNSYREGLFSPSRWEIINKVHFFTQRLFYNWKWNARCASFRNEREVNMGNIPMYHERIIPILFGCLPNGKQILKCSGVDSVFIRVLRILRREQFGLTLRAGNHEMVISYRDIRIREERGMSWDNLISEFLAIIIQTKYNNVRSIPDMRNAWKRINLMNIPRDKLPGVTLEWWVTWNEYWNEGNYMPMMNKSCNLSSPPLIPPLHDSTTEWDKEITDEDIHIHTEEEIIN